MANIMSCRRRVLAFSICRLSANSRSSPGLLCFRSWRFIGDGVGLSVWDVSFKAATLFRSQSVTGMEVPGRQGSREKIAIQNLGFASLEKPILKRWVGHE